MFVHKNIILLFGSCTKLMTRKHVL